MPSNNNEYMKEYYLKNKQKYQNGKYNEMSFCDCCEKNFKKLNMSQHNATKKHKLNKLKKEGLDEQEDNLFNLVKIIVDKLIPQN